LFWFFVDICYIKFEKLFSKGEHVWKLEMVISVIVVHLRLL
jgi:hypothetical protein